MNEENIDSLYATLLPILGEEYLGDIGVFKEFMQDPESRGQFFNITGNNEKVIEKLGENSLGTLEEFEGLLGFGETLGALDEEDVVILEDDATFDIESLSLVDKIDNLGFRDKASLKQTLEDTKGKIEQGGFTTVKDGNFIPFSESESEKLIETSEGISEIIEATKNISNLSIFEPKLEFATKIKEGEDNIEARQQTLLKGRSNNTLINLAKEHRVADLNSKFGDNAFQNYVEIVDKGGDISSLTNEELEFVKEIEGSTELQEIFQLNKLSKDQLTLNKEFFPQQKEIQDFINKEQKKVDNSNTTWEAIKASVGSGLLTLQKFAEESTKAVLALADVNDIALLSNDEKAELKKGDISEDRQIELLSKAANIRAMSDAARNFKALPPSALSGGPLERIVKVDNVTLKVDEKGDVLGVRNEDRTIPSELTDVQKDAVKKYTKDKSKFEQETDFEFDRLLFTAAETVAKMVPTIGASVASGGSAAAIFGTSFATTFGDNFEQQFERTGDATNSTMYATAQSGVAAIIETYVGKLEQNIGRNLTKKELGAVADAGEKTIEQAVTNKLNYSLSDGVLHHLKATSGELAEELIQGVAEQGIDYLVNNKEMNFDAVEQANTVISTVAVSLPLSFLGGSGNLSESEVLNGYRQAVLNPEISNSVFEGLLSSKLNEVTKSELGLKKQVIEDVRSDLVELGENLELSDAKKKVLTDNLILEKLYNAKALTSRRAGVREQNEKLSKAYGDRVDAIVKTSSFIPEVTKEIETPSNLVEVVEKEVTPEDDVYYDYDDTLVDSEGNLTELGQKVKSEGKPINILTANTTLTDSEMESKLGIPVNIKRASPQEKVEFIKEDPDRKLVDDLEFTTDQLGEQAIAVKKPRIQNFSEDVSIDDVNFPKEMTAQTIKRQTEDSSQMTKDDEVYNDIMALNSQTGTDVDNQAAFDNVDKLTGVINRKVSKGKPLSKREGAFVKTFGLTFKTTKNDPELKIAASNITEVGPDGISSKDFQADRSKAIQETFGQDTGVTSQIKKDSTEVPNVNLEKEQADFDVKDKKFQEDKLKIEVEEQGKMDKALSDFDNASKSSEKINLKDIKIDDILTDTKSGKRFKVTGVKNTSRGKGANRQTGKIINRQEIDVDGNPIPIGPTQSKKYSDTPISSLTRQTGGLNPQSVNDFDNFIVNGKQVDLKNSTLKDRDSIVKQLEITKAKNIKDRLDKLDKPTQPKETTTVIKETVEEVPSTEVSDRTAEIFDQVAKTFAKRLGITPNQFWDKVLDKVVKTTTDDALIVGENLTKLQKDGKDSRGAVLGVFKGKKILAALEKPNKSTALHELAHIFEDFLDVIQSGARQQVLDDYNEFTGNDLKDWNRDVSEFFAKSWEQYFLEPKSEQNKNPLKKAFDAFTRWLKEIYGKALTFRDKDGNIKELTISKELKDIFDKISGISKVKGPEKITTVKKPLVKNRESGRVPSQKELSQMHNLPADSQIELAQEYRGNEKSISIKKSEMAEISETLGLDLNGYQATSISNILRTVVELGLNQQRTIMRFVDKFNLEYKEYGNAVRLGKVAKSPGRLTPEQRLGARFVFEKLKTTVEDISKKINKVDSQKIPKRASIPGHLRFENFWGVEVDGEFVKSENQTELDAEWRGLQKGKLLSKLKGYNSDLQSLYEAIDISQSFSGLDLVLGKLLVPASISQLTSLKKNYETETGKTMTNSDLQILQKQSEQLDKLEKDKRRLLKQLRAKGRDTKNSTANEAIKNNRKGVRKTSRSKSEVKKAILSKLRSAGKIKFQSVDDVPYSQELEDYRDLMGILLEEDLSLTSINDLFPKVREELEIDESELSDTDLLDALIMSRPQAKNEALKTINDKIKKAKKEAATVNKVVNRIMGIMDKDPKRPLSRQLKLRDFKELNKLMDQLRNLALKDDELSSADGAQALQVLENVQQLYDSVLFEDRMFGSLDVDSLTDNLKSIRDIVINNEEISIGKSVLNSIDGFIGISLKGTPKSKATSPLIRKLKRLKKLVNSADNLTKIGEKELVDLMNEVKSEFGEKSVESREISTLITNVTAFNSKRSEYTKANTFITKFKDSLDKSFPKGTMNRYSQMSNRVERIKSKIEKIANGDLNEKTIEDIAREIKALQDGLPNIDKITSSDVGQVVANIRKLRSEKFKSKEPTASEVAEKTDIVDTMVEATKQYISKQLPKNHKNLPRINNILSTIDKFKKGSVPSELLNELEDLISDSIPNSLNSQEFVKETVEKMRVNLNEYQNSRMLGDTRTKVKQLEKLKSDIQAGKPDAIRHINPPVNRRFINKELLDLRRQERRILERYRRKIEQDTNRTLKDYVSRALENSINTYRNLILSFDLSALGVQAAQLLAADVARGFVGLATGKGLSGFSEAGVTLGSSVSTLFSELRYNEILSEIKSSPVFELSQNLDIKLELNGLSDNIVTEEFDKSYLDNFAVTKGIKDISERTFNSTIATARFQAFENYVENNPTATLGELSEIADFINTRSGAAKVGQGIKGMSFFFIAPRLYYSTFKSMALAVRDLGLLTTLKNATPEQKRVRLYRGIETLYTVAGFTGFHLLLAGVTSMAFGDDENEDLFVSNPIARQAGAIRVSDVSINSNYFMPYARLLSKFISQLPFVEDQVNFQRLDNNHSINDDGFDYISDFAQYKLSPLLSILLNGIKNANAIGKPITVKDDVGNVLLKETSLNQLKNTFPIPILLRGVVEIVEKTAKKESLDPKNLVESNEVSKALYGTLLNIQGISGHSSDNQMRTVFVDDLFIGLNMRAPSPGTLLRNKLPGIMKLTDENGDKNAIGNHLRDRVQSEIGNFLMRARKRGVISIKDLDHFNVISEKVKTFTENIKNEKDPIKQKSIKEDLKKYIEDSKFDGKPAALKTLIKSVGKAASWYHIEKLRNKYNLTTVREVPAALKEINWDTYDTEIEKIFKK